MLGVKEWRTALGLCLVRWSFWAVLCGILILPPLLSGSAHLDHADTGLLIPEPWYVAVFLFSLPGTLLGLLLLKPLRDACGGAARVPMLHEAVVLAAPGTLLAAASLLAAGGWHRPPAPDLLLVLGLETLALLGWALVCGRICVGSRSSLLGYLAGVCTVRMFPPTTSFTLAGHPLTPWFLPMLGLMLAIWLLEPARTSTR